MKIAPGTVSGGIPAPPSKSMMIRAIAIASLTPDASEILNPSFCDDSEAALRVVRALGASVARKKDRVRIEGGVPPSGTSLDCGESALCLRMFTAVAALYDRPVTLTGAPSLLRRPVGFVKPPLQALRAQVELTDEYAPLTITGPIRGATVEVDGSISSQFISGLLIALPLCDRGSTLNIRDLKSRPYVELTLAMLEEAGARYERMSNLSSVTLPGGQSYRSTNWLIEGDWSGAAFFLVAGAIAGSVEVTGLNPMSRQADRAVLNALERSGARVWTGTDRARVEKDQLRGFEYDATDCPDLFPPLAALAVHCEGRTILRGAGRLRHKESDRASALVDQFRSLGADLSVRGDIMTIRGGELKGGSADARSDHRIAMALAVSALNSKKGIKIEGWRSVKKSYPGFFEDLAKLSGKPK
jgi:3-phosphoshikimate 1-carboxyvinyltransferase